MKPDPDRYRCFCNCGRKGRRSKASTGVTIGELSAKNARLATIRLGSLDRKLAEGTFSGIVIHSRQVEGETLVTVLADGESHLRTHESIGWGIRISTDCFLKSHDFLVQPSGRIAVVK